MSTRNKIENLGRDEKIKVVIKEVDKKPVVEWISNIYSSFQSVVGGLIDRTSLPGTDGEVDIICNDNFLNNGSKANIYLIETNYVMGGNLIFCGYDKKTGDAISLTDRQIAKVMKYIEQNKVHDMKIIDAFFFMQSRIQRMRKREIE